MKTYYTVYKITNTINGEYYIGKHQTQLLEDGYMGSGKLLHRQFEEYGMQWFKKEILHVFDTEEEMNQKEAELVDVDDPKSLNLCPGGQGGFGYINKNNLAVDLNEQRRRNPEQIKEWARKGADKGGRKTVQQRLAAGLSPWGKIQGEHWIGRKHTEETKRKMSISAINKHNGKKNSQYGTKWITNGVDSKKIKAHDELPSGWRYGRI